MAKQLVLLGGGHSHAIALRLWGMRPLPNVCLTLITEAAHTPYSGMIPGHIAGHYSRQECHIDLQRLCQFAKAKLVLDRAIGLDLQANRVICDRSAGVEFDVLAIDIGSTPRLPAVATWGVPVKPWSGFFDHWQTLVQQITTSPTKQWRVAVVGGGAGGVEVSLAMQHHLHQVLTQAGQPLKHLEIHLFHQGAELMTGHNAWVRDRLHQILVERGIHLHLKERVAAVQPHQLQCESGLRLNCDALFWITQAGAAEWLRQAGLATDQFGFVQVNDTLQSISHPQVFAAGDIAAMVNHPRPKAGVLAVRQGQPLFKNLQSALLEQPLIPYRPQQHFLSLIGTGDRSAIASWGNWPLGWQSFWLWNWKEQIDRQFMQQFQV
jgi:selenide, water dikinase